MDFELDLTPRSTDEIVFGEYWGLTQEEYDKYIQWYHDLNARGHSGAIGGDTTFHNTPTSVGEIITVTCRRVKCDKNGMPIQKRKGKDGHIRYKMKTLKCTLRDI
jgi:hypothetical protein